MLNTAKIISLREKLYDSQTAAAKVAGMSVQQWNNIECGRVGQKRGVSLATLDKVAKALKCKPRDLLK